MDQTVVAHGKIGQRVVGRYRLERLISEDDVADVYEAQDERLQRRVAVKLLRADRAARRTPPDDERRVAVAVGHQGGVRVLDAGTHVGEVFVVLELIGGSDPTVPLVARHLEPGTSGSEAPTHTMEDGASQTRELPVALVTLPARARAAQAVGSLAAGLLARRTRLAIAAGIALLVIVLGLVAAGGGSDVPPPSTVPVTEVAPTTESPPTTTPPTRADSEEQDGDGRGNKGQGKGKGRGDDD